MTRNRTALYAVSAAWAAVLLAALLSVVLGEPLVLLLVLAGGVALSVTGFWTVRTVQERQQTELRRSGRS